MSAPARSYTFNVSLLFLLLSLFAFAAAFCISQNWGDVGTWQEWIAAGLVLRTAAEIL